MTQSRSAGILLHPTSLPGPGGIGDLGQAARTFVDFLHAARMTRWQILPLGPTGYADSPYAAFSSFAGNPLMIGLQPIVERGWLAAEDVVPPDWGDAGRVDFGAVIGWKLPLLKKGAQQFLEEYEQSGDAGFGEFCRQQDPWLEDYATFMAIKSVFDHQIMDGHPGGATWCGTWDRDIALREPAALQRWKATCKNEIAIQKILQYWFFFQWMDLKRYANQRGIRIIGDLPIFVALDSADVWAHPESFLLNPDGSPKFVAGVPPDYFSATGQRWGNPLYDWPHMERDGFRWWIRRFRGTCALVDIVRVDHFRGFEACWAIPASEPTAQVGEWVPAPGQKLFDAVRNELGELPLIAEDLGLITPAVDELRDANGFPGMRVLQFAFDSNEDRNQIFLPHNHIRNCVVYTGTHDNDTVRGWFDSRNDAERQIVAEYFGCPLRDVARDFVREAMSSVADTVIVPMQDVLGLGSASRMNTPSTVGGNWSWRMPADFDSGPVASWLARLAFLYGRSPQENRSARS